MKILALRGENLASLQSRFEINFAASRLGDAGLFAITGKTGAGKSTLLDAICLALYGGIPRLQANKKYDAEIGRDGDDHRIKANDVRSILSRGKGEGFAEVDFVANDGTRWCAHWSVRRARGKATGRIQFAEQWLENLDTAQRFAGKKQELQDEIQRLIGLSFEQFRRAVMLPQGEFAAFLKAGGDERAALLERMTGGEIYSRLSVLAYERARTEKEAYRQLQSKLGDVVLLSDEDKLTLTTQAEALKQKSGELSHRIAELKQHQDVLDATEKLAQRVAEAQQDSEAAQQQLTEAEPRYQYLSLLEKVQPARSDYSMLQQVQVGLAKLQQTLAVSQAELPVKEQALQDADVQVTTGSELLAKAQHDWKVLEPDLRAAVKLDQQIEGLQSRLAEQEQEQQQISQSVAEQEEALAQFKLQQTELKERQQQLTEKLAQNQAIKAVTEQYASVRDNLEQYLAALQTQADLAADKQKITDEQSAHKSQQAVLADQLETLRSEKSGCEAQSAGTDLVALEQLQTKAQTQYADKQQFRDLLRQAMSALREWISVLEQADKSQLKQVKLQNSIDEMQQSLAALLPELEALKVRHAECEMLVQKSREVMSLSEHRAELRPDEACPLCGSLEHPYAQDNPLAEGLLQSQQQRLQELADQLKQSEVQRSHLEQSLPKEQERLTVCRNELADFRQRASDIYQRYAVLFESLGLGDSLNEQADIQTLEQQLAEWCQAIAESEAKLADLLEANEQRAQQIKAARDVQNRLQDIQEQENALNTQAQELAQQSMQWQERLQSLATQHTVQEGILTARTAALDASFGETDWQKQLHDLGTDAFYQQLDATVEQYGKDQQALADAEQAGMDLVPKITATEKSLDHSRIQRDKLATKIKVLTGQSEMLREERIALLAEQDLAQLEANHQQAIEAAQKTLQSAQVAQREAGEALAGLQAAINSTKQQETEAESNLEALNQRWADWQENLALDEKQLTELLAKDEAWLTGERNSLKATEQAAASAQIKLKEREQDLREQEQLAEVSRQWLVNQGIADNTITEGETTENAMMAGGTQNAQQQSEFAADWQQQKDDLDEQIFQCRQQLSADEQARIRVGSLTGQLTTQQARTEFMGENERTDRFGQW